MANTTSIADVFDRITKQAEKMARRKAFLHTYAAAGMEVEGFSELDEAISNVNDLVSEYQMYANLPANSDDDDDEMDEEIIEEKPDSEAETLSTMAE